MKDPLLEQVQNDVATEQQYRDGIPRIAAGFFLIITMLLQMNGNGNTFVMFVPLMPTIIESLRKRFTYPRIGYAKVRDRGSMRKYSLWAVGILLLVGAAVFFINQVSPGTIPQENHQPLLLMWATAIIVVLLGIMVFTSRSNIMATLNAMGVVAIANRFFVLGLHRDALYVVMIAFGAFLLLSGLYSLLSFVKEYPVLTDE